MAFMVGKVDFGNEQNFKTALETATPAQINSYMASSGVTAGDITNAYNTVYKPANNINVATTLDYLSPKTASSVNAGPTQYTDTPYVPPPPPPPPPPPSTNTPTYTPPPPPPPTNTPPTNTLSNSTSALTSTSEILNLGSWSGTVDQYIDYLENTTPTQLYKDMATYGFGMQDLLNAGNKITGNNITTQQGTKYFVNDQAGFTTLFDATPDKYAFISDYMNKTGASYIDMANLTNTPHDTLKTNMQTHLSGGTPPPDTTDPSGTTPFNSWIGNQGNVFQTPYDFYKYIQAGTDPAFISDIMVQSNISISDVVAAYNAGKPAWAPEMTADIMTNWLNTGGIGGTISIPPTGGVTSNTPYGEIITKLQDLIDTGKYDLSSIYDDYSTSLGNLSGDIDTYVTAAQDANNASMRTNMEGTAQSVLNELASKNMLNSSVASDTMSKSMTDLVQTAATNDMLAELQGAQFKMAIPELQAKALSVYSQTLASTLLPYELLMQALETDIYKYTPTL